MTKIMRFYYDIWCNDFSKKEEEKKLDYQFKTH